MPEVKSALEDAIREADQLVQAAEDAKKNRKRKPSQSDRKFPEHLPREEYLGTPAVKERFPTPDIFPKY